MGQGRLNSIVGFYSIPGIDFSSHNPSKDTVYTVTTAAQRAHKVETVILFFKVNFSDFDLSILEK
jgi:hypothetical protein